MRIFEQAVDFYMQGQWQGLECEIDLLLFEQNPQFSRDSKSVDKGQKGPYAKSIGRQDKRLSIQRMQYALLCL